MDNTYSFFAQNGPLQCESRKVSRTETIVKDSLHHILEEYKNDCYVAMVHAMNTLLIGIFNKGSFQFPNGESLDEKYILQLRLFNEKEEIKLIKDKFGYLVSHIKEGIGDSVEAVDSLSPFIGKRLKEIMKDGFVTLFESGRKIRLVIPVDIQAEQYGLVTRSYITYNDETGQASYGFHRYVAIQSISGKAKG